MEGRRNLTFEVGESQLQILRILQLCCFQRPSRTNSFTRRSIFAAIIRF
uniref:Uncharacterized protein n=1 Tax=Rhizophora mucronata TaxID=61149 RepID=A0A2P2Q889_RHIMU